MKNSKELKKDAIDALKGKWVETTATWFLYQLLVTSIFVLLTITAVMAMLVGLKTSSVRSVLQKEYTFEIFDIPFSISSKLLFLIGIAVVGIITVFIIGAMLQVGLYKVYLGLYKEPGQKPKVTTLFTGIKYTGKMLGYFVVLGTKVALWSLLFIVPGIIKAYSYAMTPFILADDPEIGVFEAMSKSEEMMNGNKWRYFCLMFSFMGWMLLVAIGVYIPIVNMLLSIGMYVLYTYLFVTQAAFYMEVLGQNKKMSTVEDKIETEYTY